MEELLKKIEKLERGKIGKHVELRLKEFKEAALQPSDSVFKELCFCLLTANFNAERSIKIFDSLGDGFLTLSEKKLASRLKELGHRYPNMRAKFIVEARKHLPKIKKILSLPEAEAREWLVENVKGLGYKEASHFLRNVGFCGCAIIDFHIVDVLVANKIITEPKALTKKNYLEIESSLKELGKKAKLDMAALDLYLWYMETGKVLK